MSKFETGKFLFNNLTKKEKKFNPYCKEQLPVIPKIGIFLHIGGVGSTTSIKGDNLKKILSYFYQNLIKILSKYYHDNFIKIISKSYQNHIKIFKKNYQNLIIYLIKILSKSYQNL